MIDIAGTTKLLTDRQRVFLRVEGANDGLKVAMLADQLERGLRGYGWEVCVVSWRRSGCGGVMRRLRQRAYEGPDWSDWKLSRELQGE